MRYSLLLSLGVVSLVEGGAHAAPAAIAPPAATAPLATASEPVREDIVDIRHRRAPNRRTLLGWTADGKAVVHVVACGVNDGGGPFCRSTLDVVGAKRTQSIALLQPTCTACDPFDESFAWLVSTELASQAIRTERAALAKLGPLRSSSPEAPPRVAARGDGCSIDLVVEARRVKNVFSLGAECLWAGGNDSWSEVEVRDVQLAPDRAAIAVTVRVMAKSMEWRDPADMARIIALAPPVEKTP